MRLRHRNLGLRLRDPLGEAVSSAGREEYDLVIIGGGSAGLPAASFARRLGGSVLIIERDRLGGDCTWTGCVPSKALLSAARVAQVMRTAADFGLPAATPKVDLGAVMAKVRAAVERVYSNETPDLLEKEGIDVEFGPARFLDAGTVQVGEGRRVRGKRFLIATGAVPAAPPIPGLDSWPYLTYESVYSQTELPARLAVLGAGPIGIEMAQAFQRLGSEVTVFEAADRILPNADPEASDMLLRSLEGEGMRVLTKTKVLEVLRRGREVHLKVDADSDGIGADQLLVATGRRPNIDGLELSRAGVEAGPKGIHVDSQLRTTQLQIFAAGDVTGSFQFTHYAGWQGFQAVRNLFLPLKASGSRASVPWVVFTDPEVAQAGLSQAELTAAGEKFEVHRWDHAKNDRAQAAGERESLLKILCAPGAGKVLGVTIVAGWGGELVNEIAVAIENGLKLTDLASSIHAYPTYGMAIQQAAAEASVDQFADSTVGKFLKSFVR